MCCHLSFLLFLLDHAFAVLSKRSPNQDHLDFLLGASLNVLSFGFYTYIFDPNGDICLVECRSVSMCHFFKKFSHFSLLSDKDQWTICL